MIGNHTYVHYRAQVTVRMKNVMYANRKHISTKLTISYVLQIKSLIRQMPTTIQNPQNRFIINFHKHKVIPTRANHLVCNELFCQNRPGK